MLKKREKLFKKMLNIVMLKSCKTFHFIYKVYSNLISNPRSNPKGKINVKNFENCTFCQKNAKIPEAKMLKPFHYH